MKGDKEIVGTLRGFDDYVNMVMDASSLGFSLRKNSQRSTWLLLEIFFWAYGYMIHDMKLLFFLCFLSNYLGGAVAQVDSDTNFSRPKNPIPPFLANKLPSSKDVREYTFTPQGKKITHLESKCWLF